MTAAELTCPACRAVLLAVDARCSYCGAEVAGSLTRSRDLESLARGASDGLIRESSDARLVRAAPLDALIRQADFENSLSPADLADPSARAAIDAVAELERSLPTDLAATELGELRITRLVDSNTDTQILKVGMVLMRKKHYAEASEWWALQHAQFEQKEPRFALLLLVLELLAQTLCGHAAAAAELRKRVKAHPLFSSLARSARKSS